MKRDLLILVAFATVPVGCAPGNGGQVNQSNRQAIADWMDWHSEKLAADRAIGEALNRPDGTADFPKAIALTESLKRPRNVIDLEVGNTILGAYRDPERAIMPKQSATQGIERLEHAAASEGEGAELAPDALARWFARGAGKALLPDPVIAACWQRVNAKKSPVAECISLRRKVSN